MEEEKGLVEEKKEFNTGKGLFKGLDSLSFGIFLAALGYASIRGCTDDYTITQRKVETGSLFKDVDGDGKADIVYCTRVGEFASQDVYKIFYKRNLGDGNFSAPILLTESKIKQQEYCHD